MVRAEEFERRFGRWASRVRRRRLLSFALTGAAAGLVLGAAAAGVLWKTRQGALRPWSLGLGALGAAAGLVVSSRRRFDDAEIALYLDGRLRQNELIATALELRNADDPASTAIVARAVVVLAASDPARVRPPIFRALQLAGPLAAAAAVWVSVVPLPPAPAAPIAPGSDKVTLAEVSGLEKVAALAALSARDEEQKKRLEKIAKDAAALREKLRTGEERREALSDLSRLQDAVSAERMSLGDGDRRQGLEAALSRLAREPLTKDAAKALGDRDLVRFDEEMQKLANTREKSDRERAKKALEEAAEAAKKAGAADVGKALDAERDLLDKRGQRADELRELEKALSGSLTEEQRRDLEEFGRPGDDAASQKRAKALAEALKKLTPEERKRVAERMKKRLADGGAGALSGGKDAAEMTPEKLEEELRRLANETDDDDESTRQKGLDDAQRGLGEAQRGLGAPIPMPGAAGGDAKKSGPPDASSGPGSGGPGGKDDKSVGEHAGKSKDVAGDDLRSRAQAKVNGKAPTAGITMGRTGGREGDVAALKGDGAIGRAGPSEVNGVDPNEVPEEYREQVGRYFQP